MGIGNRHSAFTGSSGFPGFSGSSGFTGFDDGTAHLAVMLVL